MAEATTRGDMHPTTSWARALTILALLLVVGGCGDDSDSHTAASTATPPPTITPTSTAVATATATATTEPTREPSGTQTATLTPVPPTNTRTTTATATATDTAPATPTATPPATDSPTATATQIRAVRAVPYDVRDTTQPHQMTVYNSSPGGGSVGMPVRFGDIDGDGKGDFIACPMLADSGPNHDRRDS